MFVVSDFGKERFGFRRTVVVNRAFSLDENERRQAQFLRVPVFVMGSRQGTIGSAVFLVNEEQVNLAAFEAFQVRLAQFTGRCRLFLEQNGFAML